MRYDEYRAEAVTVRGYFVSPDRVKTAPIVVDVLGPGYHRYGSGMRSGPQ